MEVDEKPTEQYNDIGGLEKQVQELVEAIVLPFTHKERFVSLGIKPPKGVLMYGPPGVGKTLMARACAAQTNACFLKLAGPQLVQMFIGARAARPRRVPPSPPPRPIERPTDHAARTRATPPARAPAGDGAKLVRDAFALAKEKSPAIIFIDELDAVGTKRFDSELSGDREVQRTMLELLNQLDGFSSSDDIKVIAATNRVDILDPALLRSGRIDRKIEFPLPNEDARGRIMQIHSLKMSVSPDVNYEVRARSTAPRARPPRASRPRAGREARRPLRRRCALGYCLSALRAPSTSSRPLRCPVYRSAHTRHPVPCTPALPLQELGRCTDDFNGAQLKAVCVEAGMLVSRAAALACAAARRCISPWLIAPARLARLPPPSRQALRRDGTEIQHEDFMEGISQVQSKKKADLSYYA